MTNLPVIIGFGGINAAGRSSFHHSYRRLITEHLSQQQHTEMLTGLATLTNQVKFDNGRYILATSGKAITEDQISQQLQQTLFDSTLIRRISSNAYDIENLVLNKAAQLRAQDGTAITFNLRQRQLPKQIPANWQVTAQENGEYSIRVEGSLDAILPDARRAPVSAAGQLPEGFAPGTLYQSRNHPRNLQMTVYGASDALHSIGIDWQDIQDQLGPDRIAVYASNSIGQLDEAGFGGLLKNPTQGKRITSKQMPLGYGQMPADFVNAYLLGSVGAVGSSLGACATFLYNLRNAVNDIKSGLRDLVIVGSSDAPITPEVMEGFRTMGALAEDHELCALDGLDSPDLRRTSRPFSSNCGFTMGEGSQWVVLTSDRLAMQMGAQIFGAVPGVYVNADGYKKSISAPGIGNYITLAKACSLTRAILGEESLRQRSCVQAHGTSTPQNRVTESHVLNQTAKAFGIESWPVAAVKAFLGHSQGTAGGDQLITSLGLWKYGYLPGISTIDHVANDVHTSNLRIQSAHMEFGTDGMDSVILNSKGFGGNNASAVLMSPASTEKLLSQRHGVKAVDTWLKARTTAQEQAQAYEQEAIRGTARPIYRFGHNVLQGPELTITDQEIRIPNYAKPIDINIDNPFKT
ncbi:MAG: beta-ketoacyl synthase [Gammaproteobacteria bacterium]|nr:beta-ketoacyl synthase [Gammaproteobacteria bacterium]